MTPTHCSVCGANLGVRYQEVRDPQSGAKFSVLGCIDCGLGQTWPQPENLAEFYERTYYGNRHGFTAAYCVRRRLRFLRNIGLNSADRKLLDVGCGEGSFLMAAQQEGWSVAGTEINASPARDLGLDVRESIAEVSNLAPFDCITLWHSLEHLRDPMGSIAEIKKLMKEEGVLLIAVPDAAGLQATWSGSDWLHLDVPRHLHHFSRTSLMRLLEQNGMHVQQSWHQEFEYDLLGWSQSALNKVLPLSNIFFDRLTGKPTQASGLQTWSSWIGGFLFSALALPLVAVGTLAKRGGTLIVASRLKN
jgi:2-polyprenyl-3-methyl-5-hydroxy-6-metoxy-1,4-benzoquinol methylase